MNIFTKVLYFLAPFLKIKETDGGLDGASELLKSQPKLDIKEFFFPSDWEKRPTFEFIKKGKERKEGKLFMFIIYSVNGKRKKRYYKRLRPDKNAPNVVHADKIKKFHGKRFFNRFSNVPFDIDGYCEYTEYLINANIIDFGYDFEELH